MTLASAANHKIAEAINAEHRSLGHVAIGARGCLALIAVTAALCVGTPGAGPWREALAPSVGEGDMAVAVLRHHPGRATRLERPGEP